MNKFASTVIYVPVDAKEVLDSYVHAFGLKIKHYDEQFNFGELDTGDTTIAVADHSAGEFMIGKNYAPQSDGFPKNVEIAFFTDDVNQSYVAAIENGCGGLCEPKTMPWGQTVAYVKSIEGTIVGLISSPPNG
jgi:uncharacterized glyoxalase superfamily protein PhnB